MSVNNNYTEEKKTQAQVYLTKLKKSKESCKRVTLSSLSSN